MYVTLTMMGCQVCGKPADKEVPKNERMGVGVWWRSRPPFGVIVLVEMRERYKKSSTGGGKSCYKEVRGGGWGMQSRIRKKEGRGGRIAERFVVKVGWVAGRTSGESGPAWTEEEQARSRERGTRGSGKSQRTRRGGGGRLGAQGREKGGSCWVVSRCVVGAV